MIGARLIVPAACLAALASALAVPGLAGAQRKIVLERPDRRFDHDAHAELVRRAGRPMIDCAGTCHQARPDGRWVQTRAKEHDRCMQACHQFTVDRGRLQGAAGRTCFPCHGDRLKYRPRDLGPVNAKRDPTYATLYSHKRHIAPSAGTGRQCEGCHGKFGDGPPRVSGALRAGHEFCSGCHERGMEPLMTQCGGCHVDQQHPRFKTPVTRPRPQNLYAVGGAFSHERHAQKDRVGTRGRECLTCHANIARAASDADIPLPTMQGCYSECHDGKKAFSAVGSRCTQCHPASASPPAPAKRPVTRFLHAAHRQHGVRIEDCRSCHTLDRRYQVLPATSGRDHQSCAAQGCHEAEFFSTEPRICTVCHERSEPFAKPPAITRKRRDGEFGGDFSHVSHTGRVTPAGGPNGACVACHGDVYRGTPPPGGGHATCATCHGKTSKPAMDDCSSCHKLGQTRAALAGGPSEWAVTARFAHDLHRIDPRGGKQRAETSCLDCHQGIPRATRISDIANPTMKSCDGCHDGVHAFKTTGFGCYRCHGEKGE